MSDRLVSCCVCDQPISGEVRSLGGRQYCDVHFARVAPEGRAAAAPIVVAVTAAVIFSGVVAALVGLVPPSFDTPTLILVGLLISLVPAVLWLVAFYLQDRLEPEPKQAVFGVFLLGGVLAEAIGQPIIREVFRVQEWIYDSPLVGLAASILIVGFVQEFLKYAGVRYTVFNSLEFDERIDGIIYGAAIGLGYATMLNIRYVVDNGGVDLGVGAIQVSINALAHASFSGLTGYFLGRAKFERMGPLWLPIGLTAAAVLNGVATFALRRSTALGTFGFNPWPGLVLAFILAAVVFWILFRMMRQQNAAVLASASATSGGA
jgi:RsiW-degrading membrane proteinase PrsW (M82 family)